MKREFIKSKIGGNKISKAKEIIKIIKTVEMNEEVFPSEIADFIDELTPDDFGVAEFDEFRVRFEGFTHVCWQDAEKRGKTIEDLEKEILQEWEEKEKGSKLITMDWKHEPEFYEDNVLYAVFKSR